MDKFFLEGIYASGKSAIETAKDLSIAYNTVSSAVNRFEKLEILYLVKKQERNKAYSYKNILIY